MEHCIFPERLNLQKFGIKRFFRGIHFNYYMYICLTNWLVLVLHCFYKCRKLNRLYNNFIVIKNWYLNWSVRCLGITQKKTYISLTKLCVTTSNLDFRIYIYIYIFKYISIYLYFCLLCSLYIRLVVNLLYTIWYFTKLDLIFCHVNILLTSLYFKPMDPCHQLWLLELT